MTKFKLQIPTVHLNGTAREDLIEQYATALHAIREARRVLESAGPHQRDYPIPVKWQLALSQHVHRYLQLSEIENELVAIVDALAEGR